MIYEARHNALARIAAEAEACGADDVVGIKCHVYQLGGGMIEFLAIGTAVKRMDNARTTSETLPAQAIMRDKDTFINSRRSCPWGGRDKLERQNGYRGRLTDEGHGVCAAGWDASGNVTVKSRRIPMAAWGPTGHQTR